MSRATCDGCGRPQRVCLCSHLVTQVLPFELVIWQDPDESRHPLSTAPLLERSTPGSRLLVGDTLSAEEVFPAEALAAGKCALLYPADGQPCLSADLARDSITHVLVLDGTWRKVRRLLHLNPWLTTLMRVSLPTTIPNSVYHRKSQREDGVSTLEAVLYLADAWAPGENLTAGIGVLERLQALQEAQRQAARS